MEYHRSQTQNVFYGRNNFAVLGWCFRKRKLKEQLVLHLAKKAEACLKHAKLENEMAFAEAPPKEVDLVTSSNNSSNSEVTSATAPTPRNTVCGAGDYCFNGTAMRVPLTVICSNCKLRCHVDCVDDKDGEITCNYCNLMLNKRDYNKYW